MENNQPIIVKRIKKIAAGHHGGAWKIAFADFATAMMAFFLVMWLMSSATPEQKRLISGYFKDPVGFSSGGSPYAVDLGGTPTPSPDATLNPELDSAPDAQTDSDAEAAERLSEEVEQERLELLLHELQNKVEQDPQLQHFKDQILIEITQDGLRIQIVDAENRPMFALGSAQLQPYFEDILLALTDTIKDVPNKISVSGHTDAKPYASESGFGNWELSANRANAARRVLAVGGYREEKIARVVGYASSAPFDRSDPFSPMNRRIDIVVLNRKALRNIETEGEVGGAEVVRPSMPSASGPPEAVPSDAELPVEQLREQLNLFEGEGLQLDQPQDLD